jgi:hypothetical protein
MPALHPWYLTWLSPALVNGPWGTYAWWFGSFALLTYANQGVVPTPLNRALFVAIAVAVFAVPVLAARYRVRVPPAQASGQPQV